MLQFEAPYADITPCPRWCPASGNAQPQFVVFPVARRPAGSLSALSPPRHVRTAWHHRLGGFPTCMATSKGHDEERNQKHTVHMYVFNYVFTVQFTVRSIGSQRCALLL